MHITSTCMHARSVHCAGQVYVIHTLGRLQTRGTYGWHEDNMERVDNRLFTLPGTTKRRAQVNYISGKGAFSGESLRGQRGWFV